MLAQARLVHLGRHIFAGGDGDGHADIGDPGRKRYREDTTYRQPDGSYESGGLIGHEMGQFALTRDGIEMVGGVPGTETSCGC